MDDEPVPFWDGGTPDERGRRVADWKRAVGFRDSEWGDVEDAGQRYSGFSGRSLRADVLEPLGLTFEDTYFTDAVNHFFVQGRQAAAHDHVYNRFAREHGLSLASIQPRPRPDRLVKLAYENHLERLRTELRVARAPLIVTLGNEALQVLAKIVEVTVSPGRALRVDLYGRRGRVRLGEYAAEWLPLKHPGQRTFEWVTCHAAWRRDVLDRR